MKVPAGCRGYRDNLEKIVLEKISNRKKINGPFNSNVIDIANTVIVVDAKPYQSVLEAERAEASINWFDKSESEKQAACRKAFAALELQYYLRKLLRRNDGFDMVSEPVENKTCFIIELGKNEKRVDGAFEIIESDGDYTFRGHSIQGALYAVYEYLGQLGCKFFRPGKDNDTLPELKGLIPPVETRQKPSFRIRRLHDYRKNRATEDLLDWMGKARINMWGSDNLIPGMRKRGILLSGGMHDVLPAVGLDNNYCISNPAHKKKLMDGLLKEFSHGFWKEVDVLDYIGADWGKRCMCDQCQQLGSATDIEIYILGEIRKTMHQAYLDGQIDRDLPVMGYAYFDCEDPPTRHLDESFDRENITVELWIMRCWEHFLDEQDCSEDFPYISKMNDFFGQRFESPGNKKINKMLHGWGNKTSQFTGELGFGYYMSNAGNYWLPLCQMAILSYEIPTLHSLGVHRLGYMHISPSDWGPKAVANMLYSRLSWNKAQAPADLLAEYFLASYGESADKMAQVYFDLERGVANLFNLKRWFVKGLKSFGLEELANHSHFAFDDSDSTVCVSVDRMSQLTRKALDSAQSLAAKTSNRWVASDIPWLEYAWATVELNRLVFQALKSKQQGDAGKARTLIESCNAIVSCLKKLTLEICLPEKIWVDCAEATGLLPLLSELAKEYDVELAFKQKNIEVQQSIEPVKAVYSEDGQTNPVRWSPDPFWPVTKNGDHLGLKLEPLIETGLKHMGMVAQRVENQWLFASVGDALNSADAKVADWTIKVGHGVVCFNAAGIILWQHHYEQEGYRWSSGPWPAFVDITGEGQWAVSVFSIKDGGENNREGAITLYDALTGKTIWRHTFSNYAYPGGNGSCVWKDIDNDGKIEIVYGLCNNVICLDAQTGTVKWNYDQNIKICHGRLTLCDVNDDGQEEIIVATEYGDVCDDPDNDRSSLFALDSKGGVVRRLSNVPGDLGSTQIVVADVDLDGKPEIIHASENLCYKEPRHMSELFVRERYFAEKIDAIPVGGARIAVGDVDGDGYLEAVGITTYRDGGPYVRPEIFCVRVIDGRIKWKRDISRVWFDGDPILVDVDGDGQLEIIVSSQYSSGYMQDPGTTPWSDLYILKGDDGRIVYKHSFDDAIFSPIAVDFDGDGQVEIVIPCYDGKIYSLKTQGKAISADWPVVCQNMQRTGVYPNTTENKD